MSMQPRPSLFPEYRYLRYRYSPSRLINSYGLRRGVLGHGRGWLAAFVVFQVLVAVKRGATRTVEHVSIDSLKPGEGLVIRTFPVRNGKERARLLRGG